MLIKSDNIDKLAPAFIKAQGALRIALKDSTNPHFRSRYADLTSVWEACKDALQANALGVTQLPSTLEDGAISLTTLLLHESGQYLGATYRLKPSKEDPQGYGSALTYARRYALSALLGIVADEDDDGNAASTPKKPTPITDSIKQQAQATGAKATVMHDDVEYFNANNPAHKKHVLEAIKLVGGDPGKFGPHWQPFCMLMQSHPGTAANAQAIVAAVGEQWIKERTR